MKIQSTAYAIVQHAHTWTADQTFEDNVKVTLGTGGDADVYYDGTNLVIEPRVVGSGNVIINDAAILFVNDTEHGEMTVGLVINQGAADNQILSFKSDITTGLGAAPDADVETDDFFTISKARGSRGGVRLLALHEDSGGEEAFIIESIGGTAITGKDNDGRGLMDFIVQEHDGSNGLTGLAADGVAFAWRVNRTGAGVVSVLLIDEDGDLFVTTVVDIAASTGTNVGVATAFDSYDDAALLDLYDNARAPATAIRQDWAQWARYNEQTLIDTGILGAPIDEGGMTNMTQLQRAEIGAIRQLNEDLMALAVLLPDEMRRQLTPRVQARLTAMEA
jgi:hypothetical protein